MRRYHIYAWPIAACLVMSVPVGFYARETWAIGRLAELGIYAGGLVVGLIMGGLVDYGTGAASRGLTRVLMATGDVGHAPSFSYEESLVARGRYEEAADAYRVHLAEHPADYSAMFALADLLLERLDDAVGAERLFLEARKGGAPSPVDRRATESLIDLYQKTGQRGRLMAELSRTADRYRDYPLGTSAKRALLELKSPGSSD